MKVHKAVFDERKLLIVTLCTGKAPLHCRLSTNWKHTTCKRCLKIREKGGKR